MRAVAQSSAGSALLRKQAFDEALQSDDSARRKSLSGVDAFVGNTRYYIPNTMVKTRTADGTMLVTAWKSRWAPESFEDKRTKVRKT